MTTKTVTIRPFASNLITETCSVPACDGSAKWAVSYPGARFVETDYACASHCGDVASNRAHALNA